jgi:hypothetical protein
MLWKICPLPVHRDPTGALSVLELGEQAPFEVRRIFWVHSVGDSNVVRGRHAHRDLQQLIVACSGSCILLLEDDDERKEEVTLSKDGPYVLVAGPAWRTMTNFSADCSLLVLCDREYKYDEVIRSRGNK